MRSFTRAWAPVPLKGQSRRTTPRRASTSRAASLTGIGSVLVSITIGGGGFYLPFDDLAVTSLRFFEPGSLDIGVGGTIELSYEHADQFRFVFAVQRSDLRFDLRYGA